MAGGGRRPPRTKILKIISCFSCDLLGWRRALLWALPARPLRSTAAAETATRTSSATCWRPCAGRTGLRWCTISASRYSYAALSLSLSRSLSFSLSIDRSCVPRGVARSLIYCSLVGWARVHRAVLGLSLAHALTHTLSFSSTHSRARALSQTLSSLSYSHALSLFLFLSNPLSNSLALYRSLYE
jgi:hypothetical protein